MKKILIGVFIAVLIIAGFLLSRPKNIPTVDTQKSSSSSLSFSSEAASAAISAGSSKSSSKQPAVSSKSASSPVAGRSKVFNIIGQEFFFSQKEMRVKKGDLVRINFTSLDILHNWRVDEFNAKTDRVFGGKSASVEFVADKKGIFEYFCDVGDHRSRGMSGKLIVE